MDGLFWQLHSGLPREAPGSDAETRRALAICGTAGNARVLDAGCGPGASSLVLLDALPEATVTGVDLHRPFLADAARRAERAGHSGRFGAVQADMRALPFGDGAFDLIWCEGAAYIMGVPAALDAWRRLLGPGGRLAFTEAVWLTEDPEPEVRRFWREYPAMRDVAGVRAWIAAAGYRLIGDFVLGPEAWDNYYGPLGARLTEVAETAGAEDPAVAETRGEIDLWRAFGGRYGYAFFVIAP